MARAKDEEIDANAGFPARIGALAILLAAGGCGQQEDGSVWDGGQVPGGADADTGTLCAARNPASPWAMWKMPNPASANLPNPASYTDLGDGTVRDNVTCLNWQRDVPEGTYAWGEAGEYCRSLPLAGGGWRLPTRIELVSLVDFTKGDPLPTIDTTAFPDTPADVFWSSSLVADTSSGTSFAWHVYFFSGATSAYELPIKSRVRCVRWPAGGMYPAVADAPPGRYQIASDEILDTQTGLAWQRVASAASMSWADAQAYCGGEWRVPSMKELQTLVDETMTGPALDGTAFADVSAAAGYDYWSSSPVAGLSSVAWWYVEFNWGYDSYGAPADKARVRCVRRTEGAN